MTTTPQSTDEPRTLPSAAPTCPPRPSAHCSSAGTTKVTRRARAELVERLLPFVRRIAIGYAGRGEPSTT